jgi:RNA polymerase sigma-70 factor (ECF subfamily)
MLMTQDRHHRFLELHLAHQRALFAFLLAGSRDFARAEDLLQKVSLILWEKFGEYDPAQSYPAWAFGIARRQLALDFRESRRRELSLPPDILEEVSQAMEGESERMSSESRALARCMDKLSDDAKDLLRGRYAENSSLADLARRTGLTLAALNMKLVRIRKALLDCTQRALGEEA